MTATTELLPVALVPARPAMVALVIGPAADIGELTVVAARIADYARALLRDAFSDVPVTATVVPNPAAPAEDGSASIHVDRDSRYASAGGRTLDLTYQEFELLAYLHEHPGQVFSRGQLLDRAWHGAQVGGRTVDVHVRRLRMKLGAAARRLTTIRNVGYRLELQPDLVPADPSPLWTQLDPHGAAAPVRQLVPCLGARVSSST
jgi:Transcriptional regulatory protein, C terminal